MNYTTIQMAHACLTVRICSGIQKKGSVIVGFSPQTIKSSISKGLLVPSPDQVRVAQSFQTRTADLNIIPFLNAGKIVHIDSVAHDFLR